MARGAVVRRVVRMARHRLGTLGGPQRLAFLCCAALMLWAWWAAQESGYAGLPVNVLGQITGDLVLMGLVTPAVRLAGPGCVDSTAQFPSPSRSLVTARRCVQLLDAPALLRQLCTEGGAALVRDLRTALENDIRVEILLPDPAGRAGRAAAGRLGLEPSGYGRRLERLLDELGAGLAQAQWRGLDLRLYPDPVDVCFIRCDRSIWVSVHPGGQAPAAEYFALDRRCGTAVLFQAYFERLRSAARRPAYGRRVPQRPVRDAGMRPGERLDGRTYTHRDERLDERLDARLDDRFDDRLDERWR